MQISIRLKLLLSFALLIVIMSTTFAAFFYARERETVRVEMIKRGNAVIRTFTRLVVDNVLVMDYITILDNSLALVAGSDIDSITLLNVEGDVLVSTAGPRARRAVGDEFFESVISAQRDAHREIVRDEQRFLEFTSPVVPLGETIYLVRMEIAWAAAEARLAEVMRGVMALTGALAVVAFVVGTVLSKVLTDPIKKLVAGTQEIIRGNLSHRSDVRSADEIGGLARSFDEMASHLASELEERERVEVELRGYRDQLQELVRERTADLEAAQKELLRKERLAALGQVTAVVSHELRNPLGTIQTSLFLLDKRVRGEGLGLERVLDRVDRNIKRCERIIDELLDYTRVGELSREPTMIDEWLDEVLDEQSVPAGISVVRELHAGIEIAVDRERLRRCMVNLIGNAGDAMAASLAEEEETGVRSEGSTLTVGSRLVGDRLSISVTDCGPGMGPDVLEKIFEPMFSTKSFGIGLGLTVVKHVMEKHGGSIEIESEEGVGTCVRLWLRRGTAA